MIIIKLLKVLEGKIWDIEKLAKLHYLFMKDHPKHLFTDYLNYPYFLNRSP